MPTNTSRRGEDDVAREDASGRTLETGAGQLETCPGCPGSDSPGCEHPMCVALIRYGERERQPVKADIRERLMEALIQARGALLLDAMHDQDGKPYGTTAVALEMIDAALSLARSSGIKGE